MKKSKAHKGAQWRMRLTRAPVLMCKPVVGEAAIAAANKPFKPEAAGRASSGKAASHSILPDCADPRCRG